MSKNTKGIILAGGNGTRLYPLTSVVSKQLLPVYNKPMIYYPLTTLMQAGIKDILIITDVGQVDQFQALLGDGSKWGINLSFATQETPRGLADAFIVGKSFVGYDNSCLILGDNIFYSPNLSSSLQAAKQREYGATVFGYRVKDPKRFGVVEFSDNGEALSIEEKPIKPKSDYAVTGLYFYDNDVLDIAAQLQPSVRGELEITDVNNAYLLNKNLRVEILDNDSTWMDAGTHDSLLEASNFVESIQVAQGVHLACPEEIAFNNGWIDSENLEFIANLFGTNSYQGHLLNLAKCA